MRTSSRQQARAKGRAPEREVPHCRGAQRHGRPLRRPRRSGGASLPVARGACAAAEVTGQLRKSAHVALKWIACQERLPAWGAGGVMKQRLYNSAQCLASNQAYRWFRVSGCWEGEARTAPCCDEGISPHGPKKGPFAAPCGGGGCFPGVAGAPAAAVPAVSAASRDACGSASAADGSCPGAAGAAGAAVSFSEAAAAAPPAAAVSAASRLGGSPESGVAHGEGRTPAFSATLAAGCARAPEAAACGCG